MGIFSSKKQNSESECINEHTSSEMRTPQKRKTTRPKSSRDASPKRVCTPSPKAKSTTPAPSSSALAYAFIVNRIKDGDTIEAIDSDNNKTAIRLEFIDAPEKKQVRWGAEATNKLKELIPLRSRIAIFSDKKEKYKRTLGVITNESGVNVNKRMLELGMAKFSSRRAKKVTEEYKFAEEQARNAQLGIWSDPNFESPSAFRKKQKIKK